MHDRMFLGSSATGLGWIGLLGGSGSDSAYSVAVDSSGNVYVLGISNAIGTYTAQLAKYDNSGAIQWQRRLGGGTSTSDYTSVAVDSSGNAYICGANNSSGNNDFQIAKYNTSGAIQWQRRLGSASTEYGLSAAVDGSGNVYVCGYTESNNGSVIAKYDTSGVIQWQRTLGGSGISSISRSVAVDSSGNVYVCGQYNISLTNSFQIVKYDTSGTLQWQRRLGTEASGLSVAVDSSSNVYVCGWNATSNVTYDFQVAKYNTSGALQWQRTLASSSEADQANSVAVDGSGNVYVCGYSSNTGTSSDFQLAKYNTSGAIQWQRRFGGSAFDSGESIAVDGSGNMYICGRSRGGGTLDFLIAKLPGDGSLTGTYSVGGYSITYAASTLTDAASTLTDAATSMTSAASSLTDAATSLTDAASTLTSTVTII